MRFPIALLEFQTQFPDDDHCWAYLRRARGPRGFWCPRCGGRGSHFLASRRLDQWRECRHQRSVTTGTVFHGTRVPLRVWFLGMRGTFHRVSPKHLQRYMDEFVFRFDRRRKEAELFPAFCTARSTRTPSPTAS